MKISSIILLLTLVVAIEAKTQWFQLDSKNYSFADYLLEFKKSYQNEEFILRKKVFEERLEGIKKHNMDSTKTWKKGVNHMSDWHPHELKRLLGYKKGVPKDNFGRLPHTLKDTPIEALPKHVDWRSRNIITAVKDQGQCGSCWSFGTAEVVESYYALKTGDLMDLSEQEILDCTPNPQQCGGSGGCGGGTAEIGYAQIMKRGGLTSEWMYPYVSYFGKNYQCDASRSGSPVALLSGFVVLPSNQYTPVLSALANHGPLAINVDASAWFEYESGVYDGCNATNPDIDHVVQLVGYGTDTQLGDYWIVRNSWAAGWGESGYIRLKRTATPTCGIDLHPQDGTGCNGGPPTVKVCGICGLLYDVSYPVIQ